MSGKFMRCNILLIALAVCCVAFLLCAPHVARAEGESVSLAVQGWTYDGTDATLHVVATPAEGYLGQYSVKYYDAEGEPIADGTTIVSAGTYYAQVEAEADGAFEAYIGERLPFVVAPRAITVQIAAGTSVYGEALSALEATVSQGSVVEGDTAYTLSTTATAGCAAGPYAITAQATANYVVTAAPAVYTVSPRPVTIRVADKTSHYTDATATLEADVVYGNAIAGYDPTKTAFLGQESYLLQVQGTAPLIVGTYAITAQPADAYPNYAITVQEGVYTVTRKPITVHVDAKSSVYGDEPALLTADAYVLSRVDSGIQGIALARCRCDLFTLDVCKQNTDLVVTNRAPAGVYDVVGVNNQPNLYDLTFEGGEGAYVISPRVLSLQWGDTQFVYDGTAHLPTVGLGNVMAEDAVRPTVQGAATDAGVYTAQVVSVDNANYALPTNAAIGYGIDPAPAVFDLSKVNVRLRYTGEELSISGAVATGEVTYENNAFVAVGTYVVVVRSAATANHLAGQTTVEVTVLEAEPEMREDVACYYKVVTAAEAAEGVDISALVADAQTAEEDMCVVAEIEGASIVFDAEAVRAMGAHTVLRYEARNVSAAEGYPQGTQMVLDLSLTDGLKGGKASVAVAVELEVPKGKVVKVYYAGEGGYEDMQATYVDGVLRFDTNHFSHFVVLYEDDLSAGAVAGIVIGALLVAFGVAFGIHWLVRRTHNKA